MCGVEVTRTWKWKNYLSAETRTSCLPRKFSSLRSQTFLLNDPTFLPRFPRIYFVVLLLWTETPQDQRPYNAHYQEMVHVSISLHSPRVAASCVRLRTDPQSSVFYFQKCNSSSRTQSRKKKSSTV